MKANSLDNNLLHKGIKQLGIRVTDFQLEALNKYISLLLKWNKVYSLTAITRYEDIIKLHLLDGLAVLSHFNPARNILDVGSGMGVPGVILAIMLPDTQVTLVDSNGKKIAFLRQVKIELGLNNLRVENKRVELLLPEKTFEIITSRAFADLTLFTELTKHLLSQDGYFLAMKSEHGLVESQKIKNWESEIVSVNVPFLDAQRFLIKMSPK